MSNKTLFTPGPWKFMFDETPETIAIREVPASNGIESFLSKSIRISNSENKCLADVKAYTAPGFINDFLQFEANAHLIAASPTMYEAITEAQAILTEYLLPDSKITAEQCINDLLGILDHKDLVNKMKPLIKAQGGQP